MMFAQSSDWWNIALHTTCRWSRRARSNECLIATSASIQLRTDYPKDWEWQGRFTHSSKNVPFYPRLCCDEFYSSPWRTLLVFVKIRQIFDLKLWTVVSPPYRSRSSPPNTRWKALDEIYNFHILLATSIFKMSHFFQHFAVKNVDESSKNLTNYSSKLTNDSSVRHFGVTKTAIRQHLSHGTRP